jgi:hypothetical protein
MPMVMVRENYKCHSEHVTRIASATEGSAGIQQCVVVNCVILSQASHLQHDLISN